MIKKKIILLCAYACEPNKGSEPEVGWQTALNLASKDSLNFFEVITRKNNKDVIEKQPLPKNLSFVYYDLPYFFIFLKKKLNLTRTYYYFWMLGSVLKLWSRRKKYRLIHHITFVNDWLPSLFVLLKHKNSFFIWGSIGSHQKINSKYLFSKKEKITEVLRTTLQNIFRNFDPFFYMCKYRSDLIIGINEDVKNKLKLNKKQVEKFRVLPAIAFNPKENNTINLEETNKKFTVISIGRLLYIKNFMLSLKSFSIFLNLIDKKFKDSIELLIIGEGSQKQQLLEYADQLNISKNINFKGQIPRKEVINTLNKADIFLFPTLESAGFVILEAMSSNLPIVALNYGGPKQFIKNNKEQQLVSTNKNIDKISLEIATKLLNLFKNIDLRLNIGRENKNSILKSFTWDCKVNQILNFYNNLKK